MDFKDYYATLGVAKTASGKEIKQAYQGSFTTARAEAIVRRTTKDIYTFYRLRDSTPCCGKR